LDEPDGVADIFISYSQKDREMAAGLAQALKGYGYDVWWDYDLVGGTKFRTQIKDQLAIAKVAIVIWTVNSVESEFVVDEADDAKAVKKLVPVRAPDLEYKFIPLGFRQLQTDPIDKPEMIIRSLEATGVKPSRPPPSPVSGKADAPAPASISNADSEAFAAWEKIKLTTKPDSFVAFIQHFPQHALSDVARSRLDTMEDDAWRKIAESTDDPASLSVFIAAFKDGRHAGQARRRYLALESNSWSAVDKNDPAALSRHLEQFPDGFSANEIRSRLTDLRKAAEEAEVWQKILHAPSRKDIENYIGSFPLGKHVDEARQILSGMMLAERRAERWNKIKDQNFSEQLKSFIAEFQQGPEVEEARARLAQRLREKETEEWRKLTDARHPAAFLNFLRTFPDGEHRDAAFTRLRELPDLIAQEAWAEIRDSDDPTLVRAFLGVVPTGQLADLAKSKLSVTEPADLDQRPSQSPAKVDPLGVARGEGATAGESVPKAPPALMSSPTLPAGISPQPVPPQTPTAETPSGAAPIETSTPADISATRRQRLPRGRKLLAYAATGIAAIVVIITTWQFNSGVNLTANAAAAFGLFVIAYLHCFSRRGGAPPPSLAESRASHARGMMFLFGGLLMLEFAICLTLVIHGDQLNALEILTLVVFGAGFLVFALLRRRNAFSRYRLVAITCLLLFAINAAMCLGFTFGIAAFTTIYLKLMPHGYWSTAHLLGVGSAAVVLFTVVWLNQKAVAQGNPPMAAGPSAAVEMPNA
jgi:TIR domain